MAWRRGASSARRGTPVEFLFVGLANPGSEYEGTRHNVGGDAVELLAARHQATLKIEPRQRARLAEISISDHRVALAIPTTFMNESGAALPGLLDRTGVDDPSKIVIVHDELDLEPGRLQFKFGGGIAGHNGLRSIKSVLKTGDFLRLRIGVGKPPHPDAGASWVLSKPSRTDRTLFDTARSESADALELLVREGQERAMAAVNTRG
jgi:PTH1 family peptidyl-tRNA hydrolase